MVRTVILTKELLDNINEIHLHDAEIEEITCNYLEHKIVIPLLLPFPENKEGLLVFKGVAYFEISCHEPWGAGYYIFGITAEIISKEYEASFNINNIDNFNTYIKDSSCIKVTIELNSGDKINIFSNEVIFSEKY